MSNFNKINYLFILFNIIIQTTFMHSEIRYVSKTGSAQPPYTSWVTASDSIQKAINISSFGDTIYVGNGTYIEQLFMIDGLSLIGSGWDSCIIDTRTISAPSSYYSVTMKDSCILEGFHLMVRNNRQATGIKWWPSIDDPLYFHGEFKNNKISLAGSGILTSNVKGTIKNNLFDNVNYGIQIGALDYSVIDSVYGNIFLNMNSLGILASLNGRGIIFDNFIQMGGDLPTAIEIGSGGLSKVFNNIMIGTNKKGWGFDAGSPTVPFEVINNITMGFQTGIQIKYPWIIKNNISVNNFYGLYDINNTLPVVKYNNAWNNDVNYYNIVADSTNLSVDPMFVNEDSLNFHLQMYSRLIDAGDPEILDRDGTRSDIGLFGGPYGEKYTYLDLAPKPPRNITGAYEEKHIVLKWNKNTESDFKYYRIYRDTVSGFIYDTTKLVGSTTDSLFRENLPYRNSETKYYYLVTAIDSTENQSAPGEEVTVTITGKTEFPPIVIEEYKLMNNYPNPFNPRTTIPYRLKEGGYVKLYIYDIKGELLEILVEGWQERGYYEKEFDSRGKRSDGIPEWSTGYNNDIATGIYIYKLQVINEKKEPVFTDIKKMILLK